MDKTERREQQAPPQLILEGYRPRTDLPKSKIQFPIGGTGLVRPNAGRAAQTPKPQKNAGAALQ